MSTFNVKLIIIFTITLYNKYYVLYFQNILFYFTFMMIENTSIVNKINLIIVSCF